MSRIKKQQDAQFQNEKSPSQSEDSDLKFDLQTEIKPIVLSAVFAGLISISAYIPIPLPFSPVPITLQSFFVLLIALLLPPRYAIMSISLYLFAGILGLPVFAGGNGGFAVIRGPSGGFLLGFLISVICLSVLRKYIPRPKIRQNGVIIPHWFGDLLLLVLGTILIYSIGYPWIVLNLGWDWRVGLGLAVIPYLPGDILKIIAILLLLPTGRRILNFSVTSHA